MDLTKEAIFPAEGFRPLVRALQNAQSSNGTTHGTGAIATTTLTTIKNDFYGVPAGLEVTITWVYLSRLFAWEAA